MAIDRSTRIVIPVHNAALFTRICLLSLADAGISAEVTVVDNGSQDDTPAVLDQWQRRGAGRQVVRVEDRLTFAQACNLGARGAGGEAIVFLNNDTFVLEGWLPRLLEPFAETEIGITGSRLLYPSGHVQHAGIAFDERAPLHAFAGAPGDLPAVMQPRDCQAVTGAAMAVRRLFFERLHGFDERFRNSFEDVDLCLRARETGSRVVYAPESVAYHFEGATEGRSDTDDANYDLLMQRWGSRFEVDLPKLVERYGPEAAPARREALDERLRRDRRLAQLEEENVKLRRITGMRSVRAAVKLRNAARRLLP